MSQPTFCSYYDRGECRSCSAIELGYAAQLVQKERALMAAFRANDLTASEFMLTPAIASALKGFRNRAKMVVTGTRDLPIIGLQGEAESLDSGRELLACPIHHPKLNVLIASLVEFIREFNLVPYSIAERKGELKGLIAFYSPHSREMYLRFVLRSQECVSRIRKLLPKLQSAVPELVCVTANIQPVPHAILEGPEEIYITERRSIDHLMKDRHENRFLFKLSPQAFVQTNVEVAEKLYSTASDWIAESQPKAFLELFCGQGAFSFFANRSFKQGLGIDINLEGVETANSTAKDLGLSHLKFESADAASVGERMNSFSPDLVLVNPPRRGLGKALDLLLSNAPENLIYSSCSHDSLVSDLKHLHPHYELARAQIFDLFPHTDHFETLVWMRRR